MALNVRGVPELDDPGATGGRQGLAVGAEIERDDLAVVPGERRPLVAVVEAPDLRLDGRRGLRRVALGQRACSGRVRLGRREPARAVRRRAVARGEPAGGGAPASRP